VRSHRSPRDEIHGRTGDTYVRGSGPSLSSPGTPRDPTEVWEWSRPRRPPLRATRPPRCSRRLGRGPPGRSVRPPHSPLPARPAQIQRRARRLPRARRGAGCPPRRPVRLAIAPRPTRSPLPLLPLERGPFRPFRAAAPTPRRRRAPSVRPPLRPATRHGEPARPRDAGRPWPARPPAVMWPRSKVGSRSAANRCPPLHYGVGASVARRARSPVGGAARPSSVDRRSHPEYPAAAMPPREGH
jgi:hypothetical protein